MKYVHSKWELNPNELVFFLIPTLPIRDELTKRVVFNHENKNLTENQKNRFIRGAWALARLDIIRRAATNIS